MINLEKYLKETNTVLLTKDGFEYLRKRASAIDKIRAEIEKPLRNERCFDTADAKAQYIALNWCIEIIDKYKAESEVKE